VTRKAIAHLSEVDNVLGRVIAATGTSRLVRHEEVPPFQALARAIAHQQLHAAAAKSILARFVDGCGGGCFPSPEVVIAAREADLRRFGFSFAKITSLKDLAAKTLEGVVPEQRVLAGLDSEEIIERLTQVRGIGRWTVEMLLIFQLGRPDVLPVDDFGVRNGFRLAYGLRTMPAPRVLGLYGERWGPFRSHAAWYLWRAVELAQAGKLPKPTERIRLPRLPRRRARGRRSAD
jgi:DNA-3-methyladenine glycosylase II